MEELLARLQSLAATVDGIVLTPNSDPDYSGIEIAVPGRPYPWNLLAEDDLRALRTELGRAQAATNRAPDAAGPGNPTKRIQIICSIPRFSGSAGSLESLLSRAEPPHFWTFLATPQTYNIEAAVRDLEIDLWTVSDSNVRAGDRAIVWKAKGNSGYRGIVAFAEVLTNPELTPYDTNPYWLGGKRPDPKMRVEVRYARTSKLPLWEEDDQSGLLRQLNASRATGGRVFTVTPRQWCEIISLVGSPDFGVTSSGRPIVRDAEPTRRFLMTDSAEMRHAVEQRAMSVAIDYFQNQGWEVDPSVAKTCCYDLLCRRDTEELHVEVKGTTGDGATIILTANEVAHATEYPRVALAIVHDIEFDAETARADGGSLRISYPWRINRASFEPLSFSYCPDVTELL